MRFFSGPIVPDTPSVRILLEDFRLGVCFWGTACLLFVYVNAVLGVFWLVLIPFIALFAVLQNYRIKRRGLLRMLSLAVDKNIPLAPALDAYAREVGGRFGNRILELSAMLQNGIPLPDVLHMASDLIPADQYPIICSGYESGNLAKGLAKPPPPMCSNRSGVPFPLKCFTS